MSERDHARDDATAEALKELIDGAYENGDLTDEQYELYIEFIEQAHQIEAQGPRT